MTAAGLVRRWLDAGELDLPLPVRVAPRGGGENLRH
jgi:hypothetical protein